MTEDAKAFLICAGLLSATSGSMGFAGGRMTAPEPPAEVRVVRIPMRSVPVAVVPAKPAPIKTVPFTLPPIAPPAPVVATPPPTPAVEAPPPLPAPRPKVEPTKPKVKATAQPKPRRPAPQKVAVSRQRQPTANECAQMSTAGRTVVKAGGRLRGYSDEQLERALRDCGL